MQNHVRLGLHLAESDRCVMECHCRAGSGSMTRTRCNLRTCPAGDLVNEDGKLKCVAGSDQPNAEYAGFCAEDPFKHDWRVAIAHALRIQEQEQDETQNADERGSSRRDEL